MTCKLFLIASTAAVVMLGCSGASVQQPENEDNPGLHEMNNPVDPFRSDSEYKPRYTSEEIQMNRLVSVDRDGSMAVTTDETVIQILEMAQRRHSAQVFTETQTPELMKTNEGRLDRQKRKVICDDNRQSSSAYGIPSCSIGYLASGCTAFVVGPFHVLTAGHCVYSNGAFKRNLDVYIGRNCSRYGSRLPWVKVWTLDGWRINGSQEYDLGLILLSSARQLHSSCWLPIGYYNSMPSPSVSSEICGYPVDVRGVYSCYVCANCTDVRLARVSQLTISQNMYQYTCDAVKGQSGSPVVTKTTRSLYAIGVHTYESNIFEENYGTRITKTLYFNICHWMCLNGLRCRDAC